MVLAGQDPSALRIAFFSGSAHSPASITKKSGRLIEYFYNYIGRVVGYKVLNQYGKARGRDKNKTGASTLHP
jgi:hypothetical protein